MSLASWTGTLSTLFSSPHRCWDEVIPTVPGSASLLLVNCIVAAAVITSNTLTLRWIGLSSPSLLYALGFLGTTVLLLLTMSVIEYAGLRFFGGRRHWRVTPGVSLSVVAHASYGWLIFALLITLVWHTVNLLQVRGVMQSTYTIKSPFVAGVTQTVRPIELALPPALLIGVVAFEMFVYWGVRRMRFANIARGAASAPSPIRGKPDASA